MSQQPDTGLNRAKFYQLALFPLNNGATNVYFVLVLNYVLNFGSGVLGMAAVFVSVLITGMRVCDAITDPIIGALIDKTNGRFGKFRPFMVLGNLGVPGSDYRGGLHWPEFNPRPVFSLCTGDECGGDRAVLRDSHVGLGGHTDCHEGLHADG